MPSTSTPPPPNNTAIGLRFHAIRKHRKITQRDLAAAIGVSRHVIMRIEHGQTSLSAALIPRVTEALHCSAEDLLVRFDAPIPPATFRGRPNFCAPRRTPAIVLSDEEAD
jgi:transcriptional regulator with XRE-family HTH domain